MTVTPTNQGSLVAGVGLWGLFWATLFKVDSVPILNKFVSKDKVYNWVVDNKSLALITTEVINFGTHGISNPNGVIFALGGTIVNAFMIFLGVPMIARKDRKARLTA